MYLKAAQYGYSKMAVAAALGYDAIDLIHQTDFENNILQMTDFMIPLSSSYTMSGDENSSDTKNSGSKKETSSSSGDKTNEGGRPPLDISERSDRTQ